MPCTLCCTLLFIVCKRSISLTNKVLYSGCWSWLKLIGKPYKNVVYKHPLCVKRRVTISIMGCVVNTCVG